jgi:hypothetical protein
MAAPPAPSAAGPGGGAFHSVPYAEASYWEARYGKEHAAFEWFLGYTALRRLLRAFLSKRKPVLQIGCGTSNVQEGMAKAGWTVVNVSALPRGARGAAADAAGKRQQWADRKRRQAGRRARTVARRPPLPGTASPVPSHQHRSQPPNPPPLTPQIDIAANIIAQLQEQHAGVPGLSYAVADCRDMPEFCDCQFGAVLDKGAAPGFEPRPRRGPFFRRRGQLPPLQTLLPAARPSSSHHQPPRPRRPSLLLLPPPKTQQAPSTRCCAARTACPTSPACSQRRAACSRPAAPSCWSPSATPPAGCAYCAAPRLTGRCRSCCCPRSRPTTRRPRPTGGARGRAGSRGAGWAGLRLQAIDQAGARGARARAARLAG